MNRSPSYPRYRLSQTDSLWLCRCGTPFPIRSGRCSTSSRSPISAGSGGRPTRCGVAQPSMSAQIAHVEQALGVQIFERGPRGVRVTGAGAAVIDRARAALLAARDLADTARLHSDPLSGTVRIGVIPTVCPYLLPEVAPSLRRAAAGSARRLERGQDAGARWADRAMRRSTERSSRWTIAWRTLITR